MKNIKLLATLALCLAFFVVVLGAFTRLTDAGLGCPDWPGCYGHMVLPSSTHGLKSAQMNYPTSPIEAEKAWTEMAHRYAAGSLGILILVLAIAALRKRMAGENAPYKIGLFLLGLLFFQAALGMWTVTLKLLPIVVMGHLLGGMLIFSCLWVYRLQLNREFRHRLNPWILLGVAIVFIQIALGGWVSSNYAGIACIGFPQCNGQWLPSLDFANGFNLLSKVGHNYQGGLLSSSARITIQYVHRIGALITTTYVLAIAVYMVLKTGNRTTRRIASMMLLLLITQVSLGIINVIDLLPLPIAVAHNGVAALLLASLIALALHYDSREESRHAV